MHESTTPEKLYKKVTKTKNLFDKLDLNQKQTINSLQTDGFDKLDFSIIYKIVKYFKMFIPAPTRNWRAIPQEGETTVGDDVERMRRARNNLFHRPNVEVSEEEFNGFFNLFTEVGRRIDGYLNKPSSSGYEVSVKEYKTCALDKDTYEKYLNERKEMESLKSKKNCMIVYEFF